VARVKKITLGLDTAPDDGGGIVAPPAASEGGDGGDGGGEDSGELTSYARVKKRRRFKEGT
jgi:hypothetical protein